MTARRKNKLGKLFLLLMASIPFPALRLLAYMASAISWYGHTRIRKVITLNITLCYPDLSVDEKQRLAKQATLEIIRTGMEMPRIWIKAKHDDPALAAGIEGQELIEQALSKGKGLILITPHLGNWEYMLIKIASMYRCSILCNNADDIVPLTINDTVQSGRMKTGATMVEAKQGVKVLVESLKRGEIVIIAPDQIPASTNAYIFADFFAHPTPTMTLVSRLAKVSNAQILSGFAKRLESGQYDMVIRTVDPGMYSRDLEASVLALNKTVENLINEAPAQFLWTYKRFRRGPEGRNKIYKSR